MEANWKTPDILPPDDGQGELFSVDVLIFDKTDNSYSFGWYDFELMKWSVLFDSHQDHDHKDFIWDYLPKVEGADMIDAFVQEGSSTLECSKQKRAVVLEKTDTVPPLKVIPKECPQCGSTHLFNCNAYYECDDCGFKFK